jgi:hypothetical protein
MSNTQSPRKIEHNEPTCEGDTTSSAGSGSGQNTPHGRAENKKQSHSDEAVESIHNVSLSSFRGEDEVASSIEDVDLREVEASISEAPYTVFTRSQKRFIALLAACAGFFSAVRLCVQYTRSTSLTLVGFCKYIFPSSQCAD